MRAQRFASLLFLVFLTLVGGANAQIVDDFSDGDFSANPAWTGEDALWSVVPFGTDSALRTNGNAVSDTLFLTTANTNAYGTWKFTVRYEGGRLTNFNQIRIFVASSVSDLETPVDGYHVQLGTNARNVRLYRSESSGRTLLASSADQIIDLDDATLRVEVSRSTGNAWEIKIDDVSVLTYQENGDEITTSSFFGFWVKHSATRSQSYFFDDIDVSSTQPPDTTPPSLVSAVYDGAENQFVLQFSEELNPGSVVASGFSADGGLGVPSSAITFTPSQGTVNSGVNLSYPSTIPTGDYIVSYSGVADLAGNVAPSTLR